MKEIDVYVIIEYFDNGIKLLGIFSTLEKSEDILDNIISQNKKDGKKSFGRTYDILTPTMDILTEYILLEESL